MLFNNVTGAGSELKLRKVFEVGGILEIISEGRSLFPSLKSSIGYELLRRKLVDKEVGWQRRPEAFHVLVGR